MLLIERLPPNCASGPTWTGPVPGYVNPARIAVTATNMAMLATPRTLAGQPRSELSGKSRGRKTVTMATPGAHIQEPNHADIQASGRLPGSTNMVRIVYTCAVDVVARKKLDRSRAQPTPFRGCRPTIMAPKTAPGTQKRMTAPGNPYGRNG